MEHYKKIDDVLMCMTHWRFRIHFGKGRVIPDPNPVFHSSVKTKMDAGLEYKPRAKLMGDSTVTYIS